MVTILLPKNPVAITWQGYFYTCLRAIIIPYRFGILLPISELETRTKTPIMSPKDIAQIRIIRQQISGTTFKTPKQIVGWMGAMQAQDVAMAKWALGIRLPGATEKSITAALDKGEILRTHVLRPTWHLVSANDIYWMLELTAPHIKVTARSRHKELELTEDVFRKSNTLIEKALRDHKQLTREEIIQLLEKAKIPASKERGSHLLFGAELDGIICSGAVKGNKQTYALLSERVPKTKTLPREEALEKLARIYFTSHCPATLQDFTWWSGLPIRDAKSAMEYIRKDFLEEKIGSETYWLPNSFSVPKMVPSAYLLPAFDELIISYKTREVILAFENQKQAFTLNGIFKPVVVVDGQGIGLWKRTVKKDRVHIETILFKPMTKKTKPLIEKAAVLYGNFSEKNVELIHA